jgi:eukaryotic-like serine/threonine-protein kinase
LQSGPFGPFALLEPLARGGMGEVWLARRFGLKNVADVVVIKVTRTDQADKTEAHQRFRDETRIALLLAHPCIARTVDAGRADDMEYLALEAVDGLSLLELEQRMHARHEPMPEHVALYVAACMLDGLAFAHTATHPITGAPLGVVHRDISPHNVMLGSDGSVKIIDFGVALSTLKEAQTEQGIVVGKMAYMSPEQARGSQIDARADVFAVAVVLYELLAGERYYPGMTADAIWRVAGTGQYVPPRLASLAPDLVRALSRALHPDPNKRTQSAATMRAEIAALLMVRGGAMRSARDTAALVNRHAGEEIARMARARVAAQDLAQERADTTVESLASADAIAIDAALRAQEADPLTMRLETYASLPVVDATFDATLPPLPAAQPTQRLDPPTVVLARQPPSRAPAPASQKSTRGAAPLAVAAALLAAVALGGGYFLGMTRAVVGVADAGALVSVRAATDAGVSGPLEVTDAGFDANAGLDADAGAPPDAGPSSTVDGDASRLSRRERLILEVRKLQRCDQGCVDFWRGVSAEKIRASANKELVLFEGLVRSCAAACARR